MLVDRAEHCKLTPEPSLHAFWRGFALACLRNGMDVYSLLQNLMGYAGLQVLCRYLKLTDGDLQKAHLTASPLDKTFKPR
jgi:site-specific recombinase XerD